MTRTFTLALAALLAAAASSWAGGFNCLNWGIHCICPPPADCPDCGCPCDHGFHHCSERKCKHDKELLEQGHACECCERIAAAHKLGKRLHDDSC